MSLTLATNSFSDLRVKNIQYGFLLCHYPDTEPYNKAQ